MSFIVTNQSVKIMKTSTLFACLFFPWHQIYMLATLAPVSKDLNIYNDGAPGEIRSTWPYVVGKKVRVPNGKKAICQSTQGYLRPLAAVSSTWKPVSGCRVTAYDVTWQISRYDVTISRFPKTGLLITVSIGQTIGQIDYPLAFS